MQSKQVWLPVLQQPTAISKIVQVSGYDVKLIAHGEDEMKNSIADFRKQSPVQILIGPEGDFTKDDISWALSSHYRPVSLGDTRLRTETAGVVATTVLYVCNYETCPLFKSCDC